MMAVTHVFRLKSDDPRQRLRFRRYLIAAATSLMFVLLVALCHVRELIPFRPFVVTSISGLLGIVVFYVLFRFEWNVKARDPSLTVPMMLWATATVTYVLYHAGDAAGVFLLIYPVILFFGVFRLRTPAMLVITAGILAAYARPGDDGAGVISDAAPSVAFRARAKNRRLAHRHCEDPSPSARDDPVEKGCHVAVALALARG